jgi:hypothetical protein
MIWNTIVSVVLHIDSCGFHVSYCLIDTKFQLFEQMCCMKRKDNLCPSYSSEACILVSTYCSCKRMKNDDELLNQGLIALLECPVCMEYMGPPIHQCRRGHLVCAACKPKLPSCPTCRSRFTESRNLAMEKVCMNWNVSISLLNYVWVSCLSEFLICSVSLQHSGSVMTPVTTNTVCIITLLPSGNTPS